MKNPSFWEKDTFYEPCDLIVIGAGIVGLSSALFFQWQHPETRVIVLERGSIPEGASTRNAGFACFGSATEILSDLEKETEENVKWRISRRYHGLQLLRKTLGDQPIGYNPCGGYELFIDSTTFKKSAQSLTMFNDWFWELTGERYVYRPTKLNNRDVIYNRLEGALHPGKMMQELINKVQAAGVDIKWNSNVAKTENSGKIHLDSGFTLTGNQILIACNGFSDKLANEIGIQPARGFVMVSEPWEQNPWKGVFHYDRGFIYFRNIGRRLLLGGGRNAAIDEEQTAQFGMNESVKQYLLEFAARELGFPDELNFEVQWSGIMGFTDTKTPVIKRLDGHRIIAAGLSGMGIAIGMNVARRAVELVEG